MPGVLAAPRRRGETRTPDLCNHKNGNAGPPVPNVWAVVVGKEDKVAPNANNTQRDQEPLRGTAREIENGND
eukprot:9141941-Lingulodinium_polyedra.AAC.1